MPGLSGRERAGARRSLGACRHCPQHAAACRRRSRSRSSARPLCGRPSSLQHAGAAWPHHHHRSSHRDCRCQPPGAPRQRHGTGHCGAPLQRWPQRPAHHALCGGPVARPLRQAPAARPLRCKPNHRHYANTSSFLRAGRVAGARAAGSAHIAAQQWHGAGGQHAQACEAVRRRADCARGRCMPACLHARWWW